MVLFLLVSTSLVGVSYPVISSSLGNHSPIRIIGNDQFTEENGVTGGDGTEYDPYIVKDWVIVSDETASQGIFINNTDAYFIIKNCTVSGFQKGITFSEVTNGIIEVTKVSGCNIGIDVKYSTTDRIINCTCSDYLVYPDGYGIDIFQSFNISIISSQCYNVRTGIRVTQSSEIILQKTESYNNVEWGLVSLDEPSLHFFIENCTFSNNGYDGIALTGLGGASLTFPSGSIIRNCSFNSNGDEPDSYSMGIWIQRLWNTTIENCVFNHNGYGLYLGDRSRNIKVRNCSFLYNVREGLQISGDFLFLNFVPNTEISYCDFIGNEVGLFLFRTRGTKVHHCRFINNSYYGLLLTFSSPRVTQNNFMNNGGESPKNGSCGACVWHSFTDLRNNYWGASEGPSISMMVRNNQTTGKIVSIRSIDNGDTILFIKVFARCITLLRPWLSEPVPDAGRQT